MESTTQQLATLEQAVELGLRADEFEMIKDILGRTPNFTETVRTLLLQKLNLLVETTTKRRSSYACKSGRRKCRIG
jgi:hypothetical protein